MGVTNYNNIIGDTSNVKVGTEANRPTTPASYYGFTANQEVGETSWKGGELYYTSDNNELHIQTATSGVGAGTWRKLDNSFATTTTTSTTTSSSTSTSTSTSSSSSTSTSTSSTTTP